jgi:hypothetical protein
MYTQQRRYGAVSLTRALRRRVVDGVGGWGLAGDYMENDGKAYCQEDFFNMFAPKCAGCTQAVMAEYVSALNLKWHPECFVCAVR